MHWLVDGMNVIGTRPDQWWRDRHAAMVRLVDLLERWRISRWIGAAVILLGLGGPPIRSTVIEVAHAPRAKANSADDEIVRRLKSAGNPGAMLVVTSDQWLTDQCHALGAAVHSARGFRERLEEG